MFNHKNTRRGSMDDFDRNFKFMTRMFWIFFTVVLTIIIGVWVLVGSALYQVTSNPDGFAREAGRITGEFMRGVEETR